MLTVLQSHPEAVPTASCKQHQTDSHHLLWHLKAALLMCRLQASHQSCLTFLEVKLWPSPFSTFTLGSFWLKMDHASLLKGSLRIFTTPDLACVSLSSCRPSSSSVTELALWEKLPCSRGDDDDEGIFPVSFIELLRFPVVYLLKIPLLLFAFSLSRRHCSSAWPAVSPFVDLGISVSLFRASIARRGEPVSQARFGDAEGCSWFNNTDTATLALSASLGRCRLIFSRDHLRENFFLSVAFSFWRSCWSVSRWCGAGCCPKVTDAMSVVVCAWNTNRIGAPAASVWWRAYSSSSAL